MSNCAKQIINPGFYLIQAYLKFHISNGAKLKSLKVLNIFLNWFRSFEVHPVFVLDFKM